MLRGGEYLFGTSKVAIEKHQPSFDRGSQVILIGDFQAFLEHTSSPGTRTMISLSNQKDKSISSTQNIRNETPLDLATDAVSTPKYRL